MNVMGIVAAVSGILVAGYQLSIGGVTTAGERSATDSASASIALASELSFAAPVVSASTGEQPGAAEEPRAAVGDWPPGEVVAPRVTWECIYRHPRGQYKAKSTSKERAKRKAKEECQEENENFGPNKCWLYSCYQE